MMVQDTALSSLLMAIDKQTKSLHYSNEALSGFMVINEASLCMI